MEKKNEKERAKRILGRRLARELSSEDMKMAVGGTQSFCGCSTPDDLDERPAI